MSPDRLNSLEDLPKFNVEKILVAGNRGPCGGVNMALEAATQVLDIVGGRENVYTNWPVVNNRPISQELKEKGLRVFNNNWDEVPDGSIVLFSAHGVTPRHHIIAQEKDCLVIDTTCQLVTRVHTLARNTEARDQKIVYIGVAGHPETVGVLSEIERQNSVLIESLDDVKKLKLSNPTGKEHIVFSQTTLMPMEVNVIEDALRKKYEEIEIPNKKDICYATFNRQSAVEALIFKGVDMQLVVGSPESHNSQMLRQRAELDEVPSFSIDYPSEIEPKWFKNVQTVGVTSGASVLDRFMEPVIDWIVERSPKSKVIYQAQVKEEKDLTFKLPQKSIDALKGRFN